MPTVIPVKFAYATRELWFDPGQSGAVEGDHVICATERGTEIGLATTDPLEVEKAELNRRTDGAALKRVLRVATNEDLAWAEKLAEKGEAALPTFRSLVSEGALEMKPVGVEYLFGGEKVVCYFAAEDRVDFRQLVRDLSRHLHERVDMRQIGVREEAALMGGFAHCGQELCCARFGSGFEPVSIRMAKEQDLPLNSNKISGACGRLMCCLRYEFEAYRDFKQRAPKKNAVIQTPLGTAKIIEYDTPKEQLCLRLESGKQIRVPLAEMEASPAAHKKSEELGCPCRPDTVKRSTLERLQSPEIRAALEEIDRKAGLIPEDTYEPDDLFVAPGRRRRNKGGNKGGAPAQGRGGVGERGGDAGASGQGEDKRRRRRKTVEISEEQAASLPGGGKAAVSNESAPGEGRRSRRRRHLTEGEAADQRRGGAPREARDGAREGRGQRASERPGESGRAEREQGRGQDRDQARGQRGRGGEDRPTESRREDAQGQTRRRRRRPGDKGGSEQGGQQGRREASYEEAPRERRREGASGERREGREQREGRERREGREPYEGRHFRRQDEAPANGGRPTEQGEGAPRRRRRHHRKPGDGGNPAAGGAEE